MTLHWAERLYNIFEDVEDEENVDFEPRRDEPDPVVALDKPIPAPELSDYDDIRGMSVLSIPNPKPGKTLNDLKRVYGPPWMMVDGETVVADPTIEYDEESGTYKRKYKRPMGKITPKVYEKIPEEMQSQYKPVMMDDPETGDRVVDYYEPSRDTIDQEYIGTPEDPWTFDEVVSALKPSLLSRAFRTATSTMSTDEAAVTGINAIRKSWLTDLGIAPFPTHVFKMIRAEIERAASEASPVSGMAKSKGGTVDPYRASKTSVSSDAPVGGDDGQETSFASSISGEAGSGTALAKRQEQRRDLIVNIAYDADLSDNQLKALLFSLGYSVDGNYLRDEEGRVKGPMSTKEIAKKIGVHPVVASKYRRQAVSQIQDYLAEKGYETEESAAVGLGVEEAKFLMAKAIIESIKEIACLEYEMLQEHQMVKKDTVVDGINRSTIAKIRTDDLKLINVVAEGENITSSVGCDYIAEVKKMAASKTSSRYFSEMVASIVNMKTMPILAVIGAKEDQESSSDDWEEKSLEQAYKELMDDNLANT